MRYVLLHGHHCQSEVPPQIADADDEQLNKLADEYGVDKNPPRNPNQIGPRTPFNLRHAVLYATAKLHFYRGPDATGIGAPTIDMKYELGGLLRGKERDLCLLDAQKFQRIEEDDAKPAPKTKKERRDELLAELAAIDAADPYRGTLETMEIEELQKMAASEQIEIAPDASKADIIDAMLGQLQPA